MTKNNFYEDILNNFDAFCDQFEAAASARFTGQDNDSRNPIDDARVQRATPKAAREIRETGTEGEGFRKPPIDVQAAPLPELHEDL